jgi:hypothetical protein
MDRIDAGQLESSPDQWQRQMPFHAAVEHRDPGETALVGDHPWSPLRSEAPVEVVEGSDLEEGIGHRDGRLEHALSGTEIRLGSEQATHHGEVERQLAETEVAQGLHRVRHEELHRAVRRRWIPPHQIQGHPGAGAEERDEAQEPRGRAVPVERHAQVVIRVDTFHGTAQRHGEAAFGCPPPPPSGERVELRHQVVTRLRFGQHHESVGPGHPSHGLAHALVSLADQGELLAWDHGLLTEVAGPQTDVGVPVGIGSPDRQEGAGPPPSAAPGEELADDTIDRCRVTDRVAGCERMTTDGRVGDHGITVGGEEVPLVVPEREVRERVRAIRTNQFLGSIAIGGGRPRARAPRREDERHDNCPLYR